MRINKKIWILAILPAVICACGYKPYWSDSSKWRCNCKASDKIQFTIDSIAVYAPYYFFAHGESYSFYSLIERNDIRKVFKDSSFLAASKNIFSKDRRFMQIVENGPKDPRIFRNQELYTSQVIQFYCNYKGNVRVIHVLCDFGYRYFNDLFNSKCNSLLVDFAKLYNSRRNEDFIIKGDK